MRSFDIWSTGTNLYYIGLDQICGTLQISSYASVAIQWLIKQEEGKMRHENSSYTPCTPPPALQKYLPMQIFCKCKTNRNPFVRSVVLRAISWSLPLRRWIDLSDLLLNGQSHEICDQTYVSVTIAANGEYVNNQNSQLLASPEKNVNF